MRDKLRCRGTVGKGVEDVEQEANRHGREIGDGSHHSVLPYCLTVPPFRFREKLDELDEIPADARVPLVGLPGLLLGSQLLALEVVVPIAPVQPAALVGPPP